MADGLWEIFQMAMIRDGSPNEVSYDVMWWLLQKLPGRKRATKEQLNAWWDGQVIDYDRFAYILDEARDALGQGSAEMQASRLRLIFLNEIFLKADASRDGKMQKNEVIALLVETPSPEPVSEAEIIACMKQGNFKNAITKEDFPFFIEGYFMEHRTDVTLSMVYRAAVALEQQRSHKNQASKRTGGLLDRVKNFSMVGGTGRSPRTPQGPNPGGPADGPDIRGSFVAPSAQQVQGQAPPDPDSSASGIGGHAPPQSPHFGAGGVRLSAGGSSQGRKSMTPEARFPATPGGHDSDGTPRGGGVKALFEHELTSKLKAKDDEIKRLRERVHLLENERAITEEGVLVKKLREAELQSDRLVNALDETREEKFELERKLAEIVRDHEALLDEHARNEEVLQQLDHERGELQRKLDQEREKNRDHAVLRKREAEEAGKRKNELAKLKAQQKEIREELEEARAQIEQKDYELALARTAQVDYRSSSMRGSGVFESVLLGQSHGDSEGDEDQEEIVYLNPPKHVETVAMQNTTIFNTPAPIYYLFPKAIKPTQLVIDLKLNTPRHPVEYIACRDADRHRSLSAYIDHGALHIPTIPIPYELPLNEWTTLSVTFSWNRQHYALSVGGQKLCTEQPYRDAVVHGVLALDVYPRTQAAITYSNIRFLLG